MGFWEGLTEAMDSIRHEHEIAAYGRQVTGDIELPQQEPPIEPVSWEAATQGMDSYQSLEPPQPTMEMEV